MQPLAELIAYLESLPEPHILFDGQYRILAANAAYRAQFQRSDNVVGRTCYQVSHGINRPCDQAGESCPLAAAKLSGKRERVLHLHHTNEGDAYVGIELVPIHDASGEARYFVERMESLSLAQTAASPQGMVGRSAASSACWRCSIVSRPPRHRCGCSASRGTGRKLVCPAMHRGSHPPSGTMVAVQWCQFSRKTFPKPNFFGPKTAGPFRVAKPGGGAGFGGKLAKGGGPLFFF